MCTPRPRVPEVGCGKSRAKQAAAYTDLLDNHFQAQPAGVGVLTKPGVDHVRFLGVAGSTVLHDVDRGPDLVPQWESDGRQLTPGGQRDCPLGYTERRHSRSVPASTDGFGTTRIEPC